ncbi:MULTISPECIES: heavy metal-binding domain-containing protein [unclassified Flagellimonas]|uniref:Heavy metal-binding domain-containing protein n=1 Tax=Flagellimonas sp. MMG031 TaxID=3158549 RepID=A0AAU7N161_9FLAO
MRTNIRTIIGIAFASVLVLTVSCKGKTEEAKETSTEATMEHEGHDMDKMDHEGHDMDNMETADKQGKEYTSKYVCPMHCEGSGSDEEGKCPVCGMTYVLNEDFQMDEQEQ